MITSQCPLRYGDTCTVDIDWSDKAKGKRCKVNRIFTAQGRKYAEVIWSRNHIEMANMVGDRFSVDDELKKVD